jgi:hypothetical protein
VCVFLSMSVSFSDLAFHPKGSARCKEKDEEHRKSTEESPDRGNSRGILGFSAEFQSCYPVLSHLIPDVLNKLNILDESPTPFWAAQKFGGLFFSFFCFLSCFPAWLCGFCGFCGCVAFVALPCFKYLSIYLI